MRETSGLHDFGIEPSERRLCRLFRKQLLSETPAHLGDFDRMLLPRMEDVCLVGADDLSYPREPMEGGRVQYSITVPLEGGPLVTATAIMSTDLSVL